MTTFRQYRQNLGLNNVQFCAKAGISASTLSRLENGQPVARLTAARACKALGVRMEDVEGLVFTDGQPSGDSPIVHSGK